MTKAGDRSGRRALGPVLVLGVSLLLTVAASAIVASTSHDRDRARFEHAVDGATDRIIARLAAYETLLRSGAALVSASERVTMEEFEIFVDRFRLHELYPGIQGVGYTVVVPEALRDSVVAAMRASGFPDFRIWPDVPGTDQEHAILYLFPQDRRNREAMGFNMYSEATRREAMERARDSGRSAASGRVTLVQEIEGPAQAGFLIYAPVYRGGRTPPTVEARRAALEGFVYAPFRADDLFEGIFGSELSPQVAFRVHDGGRTTRESLLHDSALQGVTAAASPRFEADAVIDVAGRRWTVAFASTPTFEAEARRGMWVLMLAFGLAASLVLFLLSRRQVAARNEAEALALRLQETTAQLERQMAEVQELNREIEGANRELGAANRTLRDANERLVELRAEADAARDAAHHANQAKSEFLASMSHELRTPLNAIMGYADLMDMGIHGPVTPEQRHALDRIRRSQVHLLGLINDILNYAKLEAGKVEVRRDVVPLGGVIADLSAMTEPQIEQQGLSATFDRCDDSVAAVGDADKIQQILLNLLTNAIKFTDRGGRIRVSCEPDGDWVRVRVEDTGRGIGPDRLEVIFDPFIQVDRAAAGDGHHGVGLGLAISRDLALLMGGDLSVESEVGKGSVFILRLPRAGAGD